MEAKARPLFESEGIISLFADVLRSFLDNPTIVAKACKALNNMCYAESMFLFLCPGLTIPEANKAAFIEDLGYSTLFEIFYLPLDEASKRYAALLLRNLCYSGMLSALKLNGQETKTLSKYNKSRIIDIVSIMEPTRHIHDVQVHLIWAVLNLTRNQKRFVGAASELTFRLKKEFASQRGCEALIYTMRAHPNSLEIQSASCVAIFVFSFHRTYSQLNKTYLASQK